MRTKLLALCGVLLLVAACETTPEETADSGGGGAAALTAPAVTSEVTGGGGGGETGAAAGAAESGAEVAAVQPTMSLSDMLVQEVGDRVFFDFDKSVVRPDGEETLRRQAEFLKQHPEITITIAGHCDERGTREYNLALGERRASAVKNYLTSLGVSPDRLSTISYGKERPIVLGHNEAAWAQNRTGITMIN